MNKMLIMEIYRLNGIEYVAFGNVMTVIDVQGDALHILFLPGIFYSAKEIISR